MLDRSEIGKRGYLNEEYRLFHLRDSRALTLDYHYHEFDKLVFQLGGRATYNIEGKSYPLQPMDILLVSRNLIHLPVVDPGQVYERMVLWMDRSFLARFSAPETDLAACFERVEAASGDGSVSAGLLSDTCVLQVLNALNRDLLEAPAEPDDVTYRFDPKMEEVTRYIRDHLGEELTIERLSGAFFLSRYYLMHRFKAVYGCTVHQYIRQKRLQRAAGDIRRGVPILKAAGDAGFGDYSVFLRAFRSAYGRSPREWK